MEKNITKIKNEKLESIKNNDISVVYFEYIKSVVNYIDEQMAVPNDKIATISTQILKMRCLIENIKQGKTGINAIDQIQKFRYEEAKKSIGLAAETYNYAIEPYVINYISTISENGGLFKYLYKKEFIPNLEPPETINKSITIKPDTEVKQELINDLKNRKIYDSDREFIINVVNYIDEQMRVPNNETTSLKNEINKIKTLWEKICQGKTEIDAIDIISKMPYDDIGEKKLYYNPSSEIGLYIAMLSRNGGLYSYIAENYPPKQPKKITFIDAIKNSLKSGVTKTQTNKAKTMYLEAHNNNKGEQTNDKQ